jgi:hypothetical protein
MVEHPEPSTIGDFQMIVRQSSETIFFSSLLFVSALLFASLRIGSFLLFGSHRFSSHRQLFSDRGSTHPTRVHSGNWRVSLTGTFP